MHRVALKHAEETEIVHPAEIFHHQVQLLLLGQQFLIVHLVVPAFFFFLLLFPFFGFFAFIHLFVFGLALLHADRAGDRRLQPPLPTQLFDALLDLGKPVHVASHLGI